MSRPIAFFDFDGTLTRGDSLLPFLCMVRGTPRFLLDLIEVSPWLSAYALGLMRNDVAKQALLKKTLGGYSLEVLRGYGLSFSREKIPKMLRVDTMDRLSIHQKQGDCCVLVSASLDLYLEPWAKEVGFDYCISSSLNADDSGFVSGELRGNNCFGEEKVHRIQQLLNEISKPSYSYAYGDSKGDIPMLSLVDEGYWVRKSIQAHSNVNQVRD